MFRMTILTSDPIMREAGELFAVMLNAHLTLVEDAAAIEPRTTDVILWRPESLTEAAAIELARFELPVMIFFPTQDIRLGGRVGRILGLSAHWMRWPFNPEAAAVSIHQIVVESVIQRVVQRSLTRLHQARYASNSTSDDREVP